MASTALVQLDPIQVQSCFRQDQCVSGEGWDTAVCGRGNTRTFKMYTFNSRSLSARDTQLQTNARYGNVCIRVCQNRTSSLEETALQFYSHQLLMYGVVQCGVVLLALSSPRLLHYLFHVKTHGSTQWKIKQNTGMAKRKARSTNSKEAATFQRVLKRSSSSSCMQPSDQSRQ